MPDDLPPAVGDKPLCARVRGFSLHAARAVDPDDRDGLERLCRYGLRAPFSLDRLSIDPDGRVRYRLHRPWPTPDGRTEIRLDAVAFLRRLAALLPAPYQNLVRYHGVLANRSRFRPHLPTPPARGPATPRDQTAPEAPPADAPVTAPAPDSRHAPARHLGWAALLKRVLDTDALACPRCNTPLVVLAFLTDPAVLGRILDHLKLPAVPPPIVPARRPADIDREVARFTGQESPDWTDDNDPRAASDRGAARVPP